MVESVSRVGLFRNMLLATAGALALSACSTYGTSPPTYTVGLTPPAQAVQTGQTANEQVEEGEAAASDSKLDFDLTGQPRSTADLANALRSGAERGTITINLNNVSIADAIQQVLGDILRVNYVVETAVDGEISLQTSQPVTRDGALRLLNSALAGAGATIIHEGDFYRITSAARESAGATASGGGRIIAPRFVSADSLKSILAGLPDKSLSVEVDASRNLLILRGNPLSISEAEKLASVFDTNWLSGMSFSAIPVNYSSPSQIVSDLETIFGAAGGGPLAGVVRFVPLDRLNAVVAVSRQPDYIADARAWIGRLDRSGGEGGQRLFVIPIQNRAATEVATILNDTMTGTGGSSADNYGVRPGDGLLMTSTDGAGVSAGPMAPVASARISTAAPRILADDAKNSLVVLATPEQFGVLENAISQLDSMANQVFLEATIAEVTLSDGLSYGLTWFFQSGEFDASFSNIPTGAVASQFPGFSVLFAGTNGRAALSAVSGVTDVKILSAPSLMVLDNRTATLQVGDQVPVVTQSAVSVTNPDAPIVNSVSLRDTGIILNVTPRVNENGLVILEIDQEVSDVVATQSSGIDSPTIQQRRISTSVSVRDGESVALGGLMRERLSDTQTRLPILGDIPLIGSLFRTTTTSTQRTELLVLITPRVVRNTNDSLIVTDDLVRRMKTIEDAFVVQPLANRSGVPAAADKAS